MDDVEKIVFYSCLKFYYYPHRYENELNLDE